MAFSEVWGTRSGSGDELCAFMNANLVPDEVMLGTSIGPKLSPGESSTGHSGCIKGNSTEFFSSRDGAGEHGLPEMTLVESEGHSPEYEGDNGFDLSADAQAKTDWLCSTSKDKDSAARLEPNKLSIEPSRLSDGANTFYIGFPIPIHDPASQRIADSQSKAVGAERKELTKQFEEIMRDLVEARGRGESIDPVQRARACTKAAELLLPYAKQSAKRLGINPDSIDVDGSFFVDFLEGNRRGEYRSSKNQFVIAPHCDDPCSTIDHELKHMQECLRLTAAYQLDPTGFERLLKAQILAEVGRGGSRHDYSRRLVLNDTTRGELTKVVAEAFDRFTPSVTVERIHTWLMERGINCEFAGGSAVFAAEVHAEVALYNSILSSFIIPQEAIDANFFVEMAVRGFERRMKGPICESADIVRLLRQAPSNLASRSSDPILDPFYARATEELSANRFMKGRELADLRRTQPGSFRAQLLRLEIRDLSLTQQALEAYFKSSKTGKDAEEYLKRAKTCAEKFLSVADSQDLSHRKIVQSLREMGLLKDGLPKLNEFPHPSDHFRYVAMSIGEKLMRTDAESVEQVKGNFTTVTNTAVLHNDYYFTAEHGTTGTTFVLKQPITLNPTYEAGLTILAIHKKNGKWTFTAVNRDGEVLPASSKFLAASMYEMMQFLEGNPQLTETQEAALIGRYLQLRGLPSHISNAVWEKAGLKPPPEIPVPSADGRPNQSTDRKAYTPASVEDPKAIEPGEPEMLKNFDAARSAFGQRGTDCVVTDRGIAVRVEKPIAFIQRAFDGTSRTEFAKPGEYIIRVGADQYFKAGERDLVFEGESTKEFADRIQNKKTAGSASDPAVTEEQARQNFKDLQPSFDQNGRQCTRFARGKILVLDRPISYPGRQPSGIDVQMRRSAGDCLIEITEPNGTKSYRPYHSRSDFTLLNLKQGEEIFYEGRKVTVVEMDMIGGKHHFVTTSPTETLRMLTEEEAGAIKGRFARGSNKHYWVENDRVYKMLADGKLAEVENMRIVPSFDLMLAAQNAESAGKVRIIQSPDGSGTRTPLSSQKANDSPERAITRGPDPVPVKKTNLTSKNGTQPGPRDQQSRSNDPLFLNDRDRLVLGLEKDTEESKNQREELLKKGNPNDPDTRDRLLELDAKISMGEDLLTALRNAKDPVRARRALDAIREAMGGTEAAVAGTVGALMLVSAGVGYYYHYTSKTKQLKSVPEAKDKLSK